MKKEKNRKVPCKGERGYIGFRKKMSLLLSLSLAFVGAAIFVAGLLIFETKGNVLTIVGILFVLPMARALTYLILVFPYKDVTEEAEKEVLEYAKGGSVVYHNIVLTSSERAMNLDHLVITGNKVLGYVGNKKTPTAKTAEYLADYVRRKGFGYKVTVTDEHTKFLSLLKSSDSVDRSLFDTEEEWNDFNSDRNELLSLLEGIMA